MSRPTERQINYLAQRGYSIKEILHMGRDGCCYEIGLFKAIKEREDREQHESKELAFEQECGPMCIHVKPCENK